jgi:hypothetical protein
MSEFISEDDLKTFEGWLKNQLGDPSALTPDDLARWRELFDELSKRSNSKVGRMKLGPVPAGQRRYAVAVREGSDLWLTLWVRRSEKGDVYVMVPRADRSWDPHNSYHRDGTFHAKSLGRKLAISQQKRQPLTDAFRGTEHIGSFMGHGPKTVGAVCDPADFSGVFEVRPGALGPGDVQVVVDLVEPGHEPLSWPFSEVARKIFDDALPWVVIRVGTSLPIAT